MNHAAFPCGIGSLTFLEAWRAIEDGVQDARVMRIARCNVDPQYIDHFTAVQREIWNPAMAGAGGMLAGVFTQNPMDPTQFLVCTLWDSEAAHLEYVARHVPRLREKSQVERDCTSIVGLIVPLEETWRVVPVERMA